MENKTDAAGSSGIDPSDAAARLQQLEAPLIEARRKAWRERPVALTAPPTGLAFSGGGIRSATFSLGLAQAMAARGTLAEIDYLSTVSGGGYTGAFIGSLFLPRTEKLAVPYRSEVTADHGTETPAQAAERTIEILKDEPHKTCFVASIGGKSHDVFHPLRWLRENGRYLTPSGAKDMLSMAAYYLRSLMGVHYVLGLALFGTAFALYGARLVLGQARKLEPLSGFAAMLDPLSWRSLLASAAEAIAFWPSPLFLFVPIAVLAAIGPLVLAYWIVYRRDDPQRWSPQEISIELGPWLLLAGAVALVAWRGWPLDEAIAYNPLWALVAYVAYLAAGALVVRTVFLGLWPGGQGASRTGEINRARLKLTKWLTFWMKLTLLVVAAGFVDSLGQTLFVAVLKGEVIGWSAGGVGVVAAIAAARKVAQLAGDAKGWTELVVRYRKPAAMAVALLALFALTVIAAALVQAITWSPYLGAWSAGTDTPPDWIVGPHKKLLLATAGVWLALLVLTALAAGFLNHSTFQRFYAARLTRTFLGAANLDRLHHFHAALAGSPGKSAAKLFVQEAHMNDDVGLPAYYGLASAGPLHLVNVTLNESMSATSSLMREDRKGVPLAIGPAGMSVDKTFYPWAGHPRSAAAIGSAIAVAAASDPTDESARCERLPLGQWIGISGAAVSTGLGSMSTTGFSILAWLANARLAYWWKAAAKMRAPDGPKGKPWLGAYDLVLQEMMGAFVGRTGRYWNLSDGGHFENTAVYELMRRRVPLVLCSDNGADPNYEFPDIERLVRRVRVDFGAEIEVLEAGGLDTFVQRMTAAGFNVDRSLLGSIAEFRVDSVRDAGGRRRPTRRCALIAFVRHAADRTGHRARTLMVVVKPACVDFTAADVQQYGRDHAEFPQQSTGDQFFDEAQWESYRKLGFDIGDALLGAWPCFVRAAQMIGDGSYFAPPPA